MSSSKQVFFTALFALPYSLITRGLGCHQEMCHISMWMGPGGGEVGGNEVLQVLSSPFTSPY